MNLHQFRRVLIAAFALPIIALLVVGGVLGWQIQNANTAVGWVQLTDGNIARMGALQQSILDQETGLRGYQLTSDERFLEPYYNELKTTDAHLDDLEQRVGANPPQVPRVRALRETYHTWRAGFAEPLIATIRAGGKTDDVALNLAGKQRMDEIRAKFSELEKTAHAKRQERVEIWEHQVAITRWILIWLALTAGVAIGLFTRRQLHAVSAAFQRTLYALRRHTQEIQEAEQRLRITLESIGDGVIVTDAEGHIELVNAVAEDLTGWIQKEAKGLPIETIFKIVNEDTRETVENPVAKVKRLNRVVGLANHTVLIRKDGEERNIDDSGAPIRDAVGNMIGVVMVFRDITLERKTQAALLANEKLAVAGRLAATIAHEIHNPLDSVANLLYLMKTGQPEEQKHFLEMAEQELARVTQISRSMLSLYRESKAPVRVELRELVHGILALMERRIAGAGVAVHDQMEKDAVVDGYPAELRQVFTNLLQNAAEAAGNNGSVWIRLRNEIGGTKYEPGAWLEISDNGPGIPEETLKKLFQPFFSTKGEQGTGLGLWVSRGIVTKHSGEIRIESSTDAETHGTKVSVYLPTKPVIRELTGD